MRRLLLLLGILVAPLVHAAWEKTKVPKGFKMPKPISLKESIAFFQTKPGLRGKDPKVIQITKNVLDHLSRPKP